MQDNTELSVPEEKPVIVEENSPVIKVVTKVERILDNKQEEFSKLKKLVQKKFFDELNELESKGEYTENSIFEYKDIKLKYSDFIKQNC